MEWTIRIIRHQRMVWLVGLDRNKRLERMVRILGRIGLLWMVWTIWLLWDLRLERVVGLDRVFWMERPERH